MGRFVTPQEISKMKPIEKWTTICGITFIMSIGFIFEAILLWKGAAPYIAVLPFYGMTWIAWQRND